MQNKPDYVKISAFPNIEISYFKIHNRLYFNASAISLLLKQLNEGLSETMLCNPLHILSGGSAIPVIDAVPLKVQLQNTKLHESSKIDGLSTCLLGMIDFLESKHCPVEQRSTDLPTEASKEPAKCERQEVQQSHYLLTEAYKRLVFDKVNLSLDEYYKLLSEMRWIYKRTPSSDWIGSMIAIRGGFVAPCHVTKNVIVPHLGKEITIDKETCKLTAHGYNHLLSSIQNSKNKK